MKIRTSERAVRAVYVYSLKADRHSKILRGSALYISAYTYYSCIEALRVTLEIDEDEGLGISSVTYNGIDDQGLTVKIYRLNK